MTRDGIVTKSWSPVTLPAPCAGLDLVLEYLTEDGLFSIDMALRPPRRSRGAPPPSRSEPMHLPPATASAGGSGIATQRVPQHAGSDGAGAAQAGDEVSQQPQQMHLSPTTASAAGTAPEQIPHAAARSDGASTAQTSDDDASLGLITASPAAGPAAGRFLMLRPGFRLRGPLRWRPGAGDGGEDDDPQPSEELQVRQQSIL